MTSFTTLSACDVPFPPYTDTHKAMYHTPRLVRSQHTTSLATLIARANTDYPDSDSDPSDDSQHHNQSNLPLSVRNPCYDPNFPGHAPCATHRPNTSAYSVGAAIEMLRERFNERLQSKGESFKYRDWRVLKFEWGIRMVHGGSCLKFGVSVDEGVGKEVEGDGSGVVGGEAEVDTESVRSWSSDFDHAINVCVETRVVSEDDDSFAREESGTPRDVRLVTQNIVTSNPRVIHSSIASANDAVSNKITICTSQSSKQSSTATKSSQNSGGTTQQSYSKLSDDLDPEVIQRKCSEEKSIYTVGDHFELMDESEHDSTYLHSNGTRATSSITVTPTHDGYIAPPQINENQGISHYMSNTLNPSFLDTTIVVPRFSMENEFHTGTAAGKQDFAGHVRRIERTSRRRRWLDIVRKVNKMVVRFAKSVKEVLGCGFHSER